MDEKKKAEHDKLLACLDTKHLLIRDPRAKWAGRLFKEEKLGAHDPILRRDGLLVPLGLQVSVQVHGHLDRALSELRLSSRRFPRVARVNWRVLALRPAVICRDLQRVPL